jgi:hypothetical protein
MGWCLVFCLVGICRCFCARVSEVVNSQVRFLGCCESCLLTSCLVVGRCGSQFIVNGSSYFRNY